MYPHPYPSIHHLLYHRLQGNQTLAEENPYIILPNMEHSDQVGYHDNHDGLPSLQQTVVY